MALEDVIKYRKTTADAQEAAYMLKEIKQREDSLLERFTELFDQERGELSADEYFQKIILETDLSDFIDQTRAKQAYDFVNRGIFPMFQLREVAKSESLFRKELSHLAVRSRKIEDIMNERKYSH